MALKRVAIILMLAAICSMQAFAANEMQKAGIIELEVRQEASAVAAPQMDDAIRIDYVAANISLYPRASDAQVVASQVVAAQPQALIETNEGNIIVMWKDPTESMFKFNIDSNVRLLNHLYKVKSKIPFPYGDYASGPFGKDISQYTKASQSIVISEEIKKQAAEITEGETDYYRAVFKIGEWVNQNINYSLDTLTAEAVQDSEWVLHNRYGVCDEITVLFIALLRASGIPARFVAGQVYAEQEKGFGSHGWAEVYFPGVGWLPFDVTFAQMGWIDPTHVSLGTELDPAQPSVSYEWKLRDMEMNINPFRVNAKISSMSGAAEKHAEMSIEPLRTEVSNGSYVPLKIAVKNLEGYYLPLTITLTKAPALLEKNSRPVLLQPYEERALFWTALTPANMSSGYYITFLEADSVFAGTASSNITFGPGYQHYSRGWAEDTIARLAPREEKEFIPGIGISCSALKDYYYRHETAAMKCILQNNGNTNFRPLKTCLETECRDINLLIGETKEVQWAIQLKDIKSSDFAVTAESRDMIKLAYPKIKIIEAPEIAISGFSPGRVAYGIKSNISFFVNLKYEARNLTVDIKDVGYSSISRLSGQREIIIPSNSKSLRSGAAVVALKYYDEAGKEYNYSYTYPVEVYDIPWHIRLIMWLEGIMPFLKF